VHALTLLVGRQEGHPACIKTEWWGAGVVICLERGADWHTAQLMPLPLTFFCFSKIQIGFTFLVPAHQGSPEQRAVKWVCLFACLYCVFPHLSFSSLRPYLFPLFSFPLRKDPLRFQAGFRKRRLTLDFVFFLFILCSNTFFDR